MLKKIILQVFFLFFGIGTTEAKAENNNQFITIVNPVRVAYYTKDLTENLKIQYRVVSNRSLPATWLVTYDVLEKNDTLRVIKNMNSSQEIGIFLEVTPNFAEKSGIAYNESGSWHYANSVFLSGYTQEERIKLIDTVFEKFKQVFGYYPTSVGSWWTDSYSLSYMRETYGVTANLGCSDQFTTDGYQLWGQYWSTPYYPSRYHTGIPASSSEVKLDMVQFQWAPRDPLNGYYSSLYSTQDYLVLTDKQNTHYFEKLVKLYASKNSNTFGQITVGLEADLSPESYRGEYAKQLDIIQQFISTGNYQATTMQQFADWYRGNYTDLSPVHLIESEDLLGSQKTVQWYQSPRFRLGVVYDHTKRQAYVIDFRGYYSSLKEPYYDSPNRERVLSINIPSVFDEIQNPKGIWQIPYESVVSITDNEITIKAKGIKLPDVLKKASFLKITKGFNRVDITPNWDWLVGSEGEVIKDLTSEAQYFFRSWRFVLELLKGNGWNHFQKTKYLISQGEIDALYRLSVLPYGKVLVYDKECLQCSWHTSYKPAVFANIRKYIQKIARKPIVQNQTVFTAQNREQGKTELARSQAKYIYLVKYEDYIESIPFSPGDYDLEKVYANANAEIWEVTTK